MRLAEHGSHFVASEGFGQNLPLFRQVDVESRILVDFSIEQQVPVELADGGEFASYRSSVERAGKQLVNKFPNVVTSGGTQNGIALLQEFGELHEVAGIGRNCQLCRTTLDA